MKAKLHDYQVACYEKVVACKSLGLFLDMGLGKTLISLKAIYELMYNRFEIDKVLVIAPKKVAEATRQMEIDKREDFKGMTYETVLGSRQEREDALKRRADIYIINRDNVTWLVDYYKSKWPFEMVVCDELSSFKNHSSKRFRALATVRPKIKRFVGLTGTPSPNGLLDLWSEIFLLDQGKRLGRSYYAFRNQYFEGDYMGFKYEPRPFAKEAITDRISDICVSMRSEDYLSLPECVEDVIPVKLDNEALKAYKELEREAVLEVDETQIDAPSAATLSTKLLQLANGAVYDEEGQYHVIHDCKIDAFMETLERLNGKSVLVFYSFRSDLKRLQEALKRTKMKVRCLKNADDIKARNKGQVDVLLTHPASSAYGLNLQEGGNHIIRFGLTWNYELYVQANKRLHRQGQTERVFVHHLICLGSRDEDVMEALKRKEEGQAYVLESLKARIKEVKGERSL